jgi:hypothetical protein
LGDPEEGSGQRAEPVENEAVNFTPITPFSGFLRQFLISQWFAVVRMHRHGRICSLFSNEAQLPKLDVAGSSPVSRSIVFNNMQPKFRHFLLLRLLH